MPWATYNACSPFTGSISSVLHSQANVKRFSYGFGSCFSGLFYWGEVDGTGIPSRPLRTSHALSDRDKPGPIHINLRIVELKRGEETGNWGMEASSLLFFISIILILIGGT